MFRLLIFNMFFRRIISSVQNLYNVGDRQHEDVLEYCEKHGIAFIPWFPVAAGKLAQPGGKLDAIAKRHGAIKKMLPASADHLPHSAAVSRTKSSYRLGAWPISEVSVATSALLGAKPRSSYPWNISRRSLASQAGKI